MYRLALLFSLSLILSSCQLRDNGSCDAGKTKVFEIGKASFVLPDCYEIQYFDTADHNHGIIIRDDTPRLSFSAGGLGSIDWLPRTSNDSSRIITDTIGSILRLVAFTQYTTPEMMVHVVNLNAEEETLFDILATEDDSLYAVSTLKDMRHEVIFSADSDNPHMGMCLTKEDQKIFVEAFRKMKIDE